MENSLDKLLDLLRIHFSESELRDLCFHLRINYEDLPGQSRWDKTRELVTYCRRRQCLPELLAACRRLRPNAPWPDVTAEPKPRPYSPSPRLLNPLRRLPPAAWAAGGLLLLVGLLLIFLVDGQENGAGIATVTATVQVANALETRTETMTSPSANTSQTAGRQIMLGETVTSTLIGSAEEVWAFSDGPAMVDVIVESEPWSDLVLIIFGPAGQQLEYVDFLRNGEGEKRLYYTIPDGGHYQFLVQDLRAAGGEYRLSVKPSVPGQIGLGETVSGTLIGANQALWLFDEGPATIAITLRVGPQDTGVLILFGPNGRQLEYNDSNTGGQVRLQATIPDNGAYTIVVDDSTNDGANYTLAVEER